MIDEKRKFYFSLPRHQARLALGYDTGELNFRANRRHESLARYGTTECWVPGCCQQDNLEHVKQCYGYSAKLKESGDPMDLVLYLNELDIERFKKFKTSLVHYDT